MGQNPPRLSPFRPLDPSHRVDAFRSGDADIDRFLHHSAAIEQRMRLSQVYVTADSDQAVRGYFTLSPLTIRIDAVVLAALGLEGLPYSAIGGFLLGRLGVDLPLQGKGVGEALVMRAAQIAKQESERVGGAFLAVDPKSDRPIAWYARLEFIALGGRSGRMILPLTAIP